MPKTKTLSAIQGSKRRSAAARRRAIQALQEGTTPLEYLLEVMRDEHRGADDRMEAAKAAAPYCHPKLAATVVEKRKGRGASSLDTEDLERIARGA